jgi:hypothetical protein
MAWSFRVGWGVEVGLELRTAVHFERRLAIFAGGSVWLRSSSITPLSFPAVIKTLSINTRS